MEVNNWTISDVPPMNELQFENWSLFLERRLGQELSEKRKTFLTTSLYGRMRELGIDDYDTYLALVTAGVRGLMEWSILIDRITIHETRFFRDRDAFNLLRPFVIDRSGRQDRHLKIWSVGCATGEEPYSLAIAIWQACESHGLQTDFIITATDISTKALGKASRGAFMKSRISLLPAFIRNNFFDTDKGEYQVRTFIRDKVCFVRDNLTDVENSPFEEQDVIWCQNVLIYFAQQKRHEIVDQYAQRLAPGGLLILGMGEVINYQHPDLVRVPDNKVLAFLKRESK